MNFLQLAKKFWESIGAVPAIVVTIYLTGFLVLNAYLTHYGVIEVNVISYNSIKASIIFLAFNSLIVSLALHSLSNSQNSGSVFATSLFSIGIGIFYGIIIFLMEKAFKLVSGKQFDVVEIYLVEKMLLIMLLLVFIIFLAVYYPNISGLKTIGLIFVSLLLCVVSLSVGPPIIKTTAAYCFVVSIVCLYVFKNVLKGHTSGLGDVAESIAAIIALVFMSCVLFGFLIYDKLPTQIGGGRPYYLRFYVSKSEMDSLLDSKVIKSAEVLEQPAKVIYVSDKKYYIEINGKVISLDLENVKGVVRN